MPALYVLIGIPGSGKSTWARANAQRLHAVIVSSDIVRRDLRAHGQNPLNGDLVFAEVEDRAREQLGAGRSVILDATHSLRKYRTYAIHLASDFHVHCIGIWFDLPLEVGLQRNVQRTQEVFGDEEVPEAVVRQMYHRFQPPGKDEFDEIVRINS